MNASIILSLALLITLEGSGVLKSVSQRETSQQATNRVPVIERFASSVASVKVCPKRTYGCEGSTTALEVRANDPDGDVLAYKYFVSGGLLTGEGPRVTWDLAGSFEGNQRATAVVEVYDTKGGKATAQIEVMTSECSSCHVTCPVISVSCIDVRKPDDPAQFTGSVTGISEVVRWEWTIFGGVIVEGQGTPTIIVKRSQGNRGALTATLTVGGAPCGCASTASCSTNIHD